MTKAEYRSLIKNLLAKIDKENKYHEMVIDHAVDHALAQIYWEVWKQNPPELDNYTKEYGVSTAITVTQNATTTIYESTIPEVYIPMPDKASGIRHIFTLEQGGIVFVPMSQTEIDYVPNTLVGELTDRIGYAVKNEKVEYWNMNAVVAAAGVRMEILIPFTAYEDDDVVKLPFGINEEILQLVLVYLKDLPEVDLNDLEEKVQTK